MFWSEMLANTTPLHQRGRLMAALTAAFFLVQALVVPYMWDPTPDSSRYMAIARNLSQGELGGLGFSHFLVAPVYPFLLTPSFWIDHTPFVVIGILHLFVGLLMVWASWRWYVTVEEDHRLQLICYVLLICHPSIWHFVRMYLSEGLFLGLWGVAMWRIDAFYRAQTARHLVEVIVTLTLLALTRHAGFALTCGLVCSLLLKACVKQLPWSRAFLYAGLFFGVVASVVYLERKWDEQLATVSQQSTQTYGEALIQTAVSSDVGHSLLWGAYLRFSECSRLVMPGMIRAYATDGPGLYLLGGFYFLIFSIILVGWVYYLRKKQDAWMCACPFYFGLYALWPFDQGVRFMFPLLPLLLICAVRGLLIVSSRLGPAHRWMPAFYAAIFVNLAFCTYEVYKQPTHHQLTTEWNLATKICQSGGASHVPEASELTKRQRYRMSLFCSFLLDRQLGFAELPENVEIKK